MGRQKVEVTDLEKAVISLIKEKAVKLNLSINALAIASDMHQATLHRMLSETQNLTLAYLEKVCKGLGVRASELVKTAELLVIERQYEAEHQKRQAQPAPISDLPIPPQPTQEELEALLAEADIAAAARDIPKGLENLGEDWTRQDLDWPE